MVDATCCDAPINADLYHGTLAGLGKALPEFKYAS